MRKTKEEKSKEIIKNNYNSDLNLYFIHIPKNAGRMVRLNLWSKLSNSKTIPTHFTADYVNSFEEYQDVNNFVFSRNPYTRMASCYYFFYPRAVKRKIKRRKSDVALADYDSFRDFIYDLPNLSISNDMEENRRLMKHDLNFFFSKQVNWINDKTIFKAKKENLLEDINRFCDTFGVQDLKVDELRSRAPFITRRHESENIPYMDLYDSSMIKIINKIYEEDFEYFNYEML